MHARRLLRIGLRWWPWAGLLLWIVVCPARAVRGVQFGITDAAPLELSPPQVNRVSNATLARLEQFRVLMTNSSWAEAIEVLDELSAEPTTGVVDLGDGRHVDLPTYCQLQLARMPAAAIVKYRRRVDTLAEEWYHAGIAASDERLLRRLVQSHYCSSWTDEALWALGELALERADYGAARRWWEQISPLLRDPDGRPLWLSLQGIDLEAHWPFVEQRWNERPAPPTWLAYPDTDLDLATVRAGLIVASIRAGDSSRATIELAAFRRFHPQAEGRLGGQTENYAVLLERLLKAAQDWTKQPVEMDWPTFAGSPTRSTRIASLGPITGPMWSAPVTFSPVAVPRGGEQDGQWLAGDLERDSRPQQPVRETQRPLTCFPVSVNGAIAFCDNTQIVAVDLQTGRPALTSSGVLYRVENGSAADAIDVFPFGGRANLAFGRGIPIGVPRQTLTIAGGVLYGRLGQLETAAQINEARSSSNERLIGLDLQRDGQLTFRARPHNARWSFDGVPIGDDRRLFVALREGSASPRAHIACYDVTTGNEVWRTYIGTADTPGGTAQEFAHNLLTLVGDRVYCNTNLGLVAAIDSEDGRISWIHRYERRTAQSAIVGQSMPLHFSRGPAPCLYHGGSLIVAPADTPRVFSIDAETGQLLWSNEQVLDVVHLLGVVRDNVIASGNRLAALDARTGQLQFVWPESETAGIRGMGRGIVAGDEVFWPVRNEIMVVNGTTGRQSRPPIRLNNVSDCGANLAAARGRLIVAGYDKIMAYGPAPAMPAPGGDTEQGNSLSTTNRNTANSDATVQYRTYRPLD